MKKFTSILMACSALTAFCAGGINIIYSNDDITKAFAEEEQTKLTQNCKSAYLIDATSGECIYKENENKRMPIASVCKVMTLTLCFEAIENGKLTYDDNITISDEASGMGGSQVYLESGLTYNLSDLIKSIIVCSANDSCVAVAQTVSGSEDAFVAKMNKRAEELGCTDTLFANCTGLPKETQYSCAKDVALMFKNLISHDEYFNYSKIWLEDFKHPDDRITTITNTNKLIRKYSYCDGGKTGFTNEAGFCLTATAIKDNLRLISVVLGGGTSDDRFNSTISMFNYGFANYKNAIVLDNNVNLNDKFFVDCGKKEEVFVHPERNSYVFSKIGQTPQITFNVIANTVKAPLNQGDVVGKIEVYKDGLLCDSVNLLSSECVEKATYGDYLKKVSKDWTL